MNLIHGDCLAVMPTLPNASVNMVLADLPYGTTQCRWDVQIPLEPLWEQYRRLCPTGAICLHAQLPFDKVLGCSNLSWLRYEWVWEKGNPTGHLNAQRAPMKAHEVVLVFCSGQPPYYPQKTQGHERKKTIKRLGDETPIYNAQKFDVLHYDSTERYPRSVLRFSSDKQRRPGHPTRKPIALLEYLIQTHSLPGDVVLDNCMGGGSTGIAARNTGRYFVGIESDPTFFEMATRALS